MRSIAAGVLASAALLCAGCASVSHGSTETLRIETVTESGALVEGADCTVRNDAGTTVALSGQPTTVTRSPDDLHVACSKDGLPQAKGRLVSRSNGMVMGNVLVGGVLGALVDHRTGAAYSYPSWVRLVFGQYGVYDRAQEVHGTPGMAPVPPLPGSEALRPKEPAPPEEVRLPEPRREAERLAAERLARQQREVAEREAERREAVRRDLQQQLQVRLEAEREQLARREAEQREAVARLEQERRELEKLEEMHQAVARLRAQRPKLLPGLVLNYRITDRVTGAAHTVVLRGERTVDGRVSFNDGLRVEKSSGELLELNAALLGELDMVTPAGGWLPGGALPTGMWKIRSASIVPGAQRQYDLVATVEGDREVEMAAGRMPAQRISLRGWVRHTNGALVLMARYEGSVWVSAELRRVVRFEAKSRTQGNAGTSFVYIDEAAELVRAGDD